PGHPGSPPNLWEHRPAVLTKHTPVEGNPTTMRHETTQHNRGNGWLTPAGATPRCGSQALQDCSHPDRYEQIWQLRAEPARSPCRWISREALGVLFIEPGEVLGSGQQHLDLHDIPELCAGGPQDSLAIHECLPCLLLDRGAGWLARLRIDAEGARYI